MTAKDFSPQGNSVPRFGRLAEISPGARNGPYGTPGLVSIINRVTEEPLEETQSAPDGEERLPAGETLGSKASSRIPLPSSPPAVNLESPTTKALSPSGAGVGYASRIPYSSQVPRMSRVSPPRLVKSGLASPEGPNAKPGPHQGIPRPQSPPPASIPAPKVKSSIPTLASPPPPVGIKSPTGIPTRFEWPKVAPPYEESKEVSPPRSAPATRIPARTPSQTERESFIPVKRSPKSPGAVPLSPVDKPINQTGIPPLEPSAESSDKSSRIPTFPNSSKWCIN